MRAAGTLLLSIVLACLPAAAGGTIPDPNPLLSRTFISVTPGADFELGNFEHRLDRFTNISTSQTLFLGSVEAVLLNPEDVGFADLEPGNVPVVVAAAASAHPEYGHWGTSFWNYPGGIPALDVPPVTWVFAEFDGVDFPLELGPGESFVLETVAHNNLFGPADPPPARIGELIVGWRFLIEDCGNGVVEQSESCDDGNDVDDDGCRNDCTVPFCGDGIVDSINQESCDDGNEVDDDGCRNNCNLPICGDFIVDAQNGETCDPPGAPSGASENDCREDCTVCGDGVVDAAESCDDGNASNDDACRNDCTVPICGDGIVDSTEDCDDENLVDDDGCRNDCTIPICGDGIVDSINEESCDDGNQVDNDGCRNDCSIPICGDFIVDPQNGETCDPPGAPSGASENDCREDCTVCGDGVVDAEESCDDGNASDEDACRNDCTVPICGDGIVDSTEDCDDENLVDDDGCRNDCTIPFCGDGIVDSINEESCDDGNQVDDDGCRNNCSIPICGDFIVDPQNGETCDPPFASGGASGNVCRLDCTVCGDGIIDPGEECDDGNNLETDLCRNDCTEPGIISRNAAGANSVAVEDVDGDGDYDVVSASGLDNKIAWHENIDTTGDGLGDAEIWVEHLVSDQALDPRMVTSGFLGFIPPPSFRKAGATGPVDVEPAEGETLVAGKFLRPSLFSASFADNRIAVYQIVIGAGLTWFETTISDTVAGASSVHVADLNGDFCNDVLATSQTDGEVLWFADIECNGSLWSSAFVIDDALGGARAAVAGPLNFDSSLDVVAVGFDANSVVAYLNGDAGTAWTRILISNTAFGATALAIGNFDGDSDHDVVVASSGDNSITWYENVDVDELGGDGTTWSPHIVSATAGGASAVYAIDLDFDEDDDILAAAADDGTITWYENANGAGSVWIPHTLSSTSPGASSVVPGDLNGDFLFDVVSASYDNDTVAWFQNVSGRFKGNCGDGEVNAFETCDPPGASGGGNGNLCRNDCTVCGDGIVDVGEDCDDGNGTDGDQCDSTCLRAPISEGRNRAASR